MIPASYAAALICDEMVFESFCVESLVNDFLHVGFDVISLAIADGFDEQILKRPVFKGFAEDIEDLAPQSRLFVFNSRTV
jgi:hypothetical protein